MRRVKRVPPEGEVSRRTSAPCPACATSYAELDPRLFSYNSKHGWCPDCYGTGLKLQGFDAEQSGEEIWCQGYSEPGSGSDLASLKMRAQLVSLRTAVVGGWCGTTFSLIDCGFSDVDVSNAQNKIFRYATLGAPGALDFGTGVDSVEIRAAAALPDGRVAALRVPGGGDLRNRSRLACAMRVSAWLVLLATLLLWSCNWIVARAVRDDIAPGARWFNRLTIE